MNEIKCGNCVKFKTQYCPCSIDCMATDDYPYFQDKRMMLEENQQLKEKIEMLKQADRNTYESAQDMLSELEIENQQLKEQLQQRDEVIEECIESIQNFMTHIDDDFCADMMTFIDILNKYKGDN